MGPTAVLTFLHSHPLITGVSAHRVLDRAVLRGRLHRALPLPTILLGVRRPERLGRPAPPEPASAVSRTMRSSGVHCTHRAVYGAEVVDRPSGEARYGRLGDVARVCG